MWILDCDGDFLQGKRLWLKPGQRYLFGRVKKDGVHFLIEHKSISRKHFVIEVDKVNEGDGSHVHVRTKIAITDLNSKGGTHIDGELIKDGTKQLDRAEHFLRPGSYPKPIRIQWSPVVLTFSLTPRELKIRDALKPKRERLEPFDIKVVTDYVNETTHVVASKRNTAKGLQALVNAKYIVDETFVDALVYVATPSDLGEEENTSPLEQNFDDAWPKEADYLPPAGKEPTHRPDDVYTPNERRKPIFEGYTFVFGDQAQLDLLAPAINAGHGKAILFNVLYGQTTVEDAVQFMRNTAGDKSFGEFRDDEDNGAVVMVRWKAPEEWKKWANELMNEVSYALDQRSIDQGEFLDAILANDSRLLRRALESASTGAKDDGPIPPSASFISVPPPPASEAQLPTLPTGERQSKVEVASSPPPDQRVPQEQTSTAEELPKRRSRLRGPGLRKLRAFDDDFDADAVPSFSGYEAASQDVVSQEDFESIPNSRLGSEVSVKEEQVRRQGRESSTKRLRPTSDSDEAMEDELLPAATAMKRRRLEMERENARKGITVQPKKSIPVTKPKKKRKEIDVLEVARQQRQAEEESARQDKEHLEGLEKIEHDKPANLVVVEEMDLPMRTDNSERISGVGVSSERWDERWNGRKNFKKFRKKGVVGAQEDRVNLKVLVPLVEVKKARNGLEERHRDRGREREDNRNGTGCREGKVDHVQAQTTSQSQPKMDGRSQTPGSDNGDENEARQTSPSIARLRQEAAEIAGEIDMDEPRRTRLTDKTAQSQNQKRPAPVTSKGIRSAKRQRTIQTRPARDDSDEEEDLKFRFGRSRR